MSPWLAKIVKHHLKWSQIKASDISQTLGKAIGLFFEKAVSRMKSPNRPKALMKCSAIYSDLALHLGNAWPYKWQKLKVLH